MEGATVAGVTVVVEVIQDQPEAAHRHQEHTVVQQYVQVPERLEQVPAEATAVAPLAHHDRAQRGQAAPCGKDRPRGAVRKPVPLSPQET